MDEKEINILIRDINGKRTEYKFPNRENLIWFLNTESPNNEDEILLVIWDGKCIYNQLSTAFPILWEDIVGFFA